MRIACLVALAALAACARPTLIGTPCASDRDCNVAGQRCVGGPGAARICTHGCAAQSGPSGCPIGFDCSAADPATPAQLTCNRERYAFDPTTGGPRLFGVACALAPGTTQAEWDQACLGTGDPAPLPTCRHAADPNSHATPPAPIRDDPDAYCTAGCAVDADCPVAMRCAVDYDGATRCLRRGFCDPCTIDDDCPAELHACVPTADGSARYCTKPCAAQDDCGGATGTFLACAPSSDSLGAGGTYCLHRFGACVGAGHVCDPCLGNADCGAGTACVTNALTGERMCTKSCFTDADCASDLPTGCDFGPPPQKPGDPSYTDLCTGDATHQHPGVLSCFF
jgi:hypothetical protein